jgi:hypothetical protein
MTDLLEFWGSKLDQIEGMTAAYSCNQQLYSFILTPFDLHNPRRVGNGTFAAPSA